MQKTKRRVKGKSEFSLEPKEKAYGPRSWLDCKGEISELGGYEMSSDSVKA